MWTAAVINDAQAPYHDQRALDVAGQIIADAKVDLLVQNGDWADFRSISRYPLRNRDPKLFTELRSELASAREIWWTFIKGVKPKRITWSDGNHEFRVARAFNNTPNAFQLLDLPEVDFALSTPSLFHFTDSKIPIKYSGEYPNGCWLKEGIEPEKNVWVEHGFTARQKGGYTVTNMADKRWTSLIVGHCEKLAGPIWTRKLGRDYFLIENGNLSGIAEPEGRGIYGGVPHSVPEYMDHRQGFSLIFYDAGQFWPFTIKIRDGKAHWQGKLWKA